MEDLSDSLCALCGERIRVMDDAVCPACGGEHRLAGRFRLVRVLGEGATGTTYLAQDPAGTAVAVKETLLRSSDAAKARELLEREALVLRQLAHPQIPAYVDHGLAGSGKSRFFWLAQEFVDGQDLAAELGERRYVEADVVAVLRQLCDVLTYLHTLSPPVIHRDLKPRNVMRRDDGTLVLIDFGSVRDVLKDARLGGSTVAGTFGYMAPEQFMGEATPRTDLYGLGALAVALLTRRDPATLQVPDRTIAWRGHCAPSPRLGQLLDRLLAADPADRPPSAAAVAELLDGASPLAALRDVPRRPQGDSHGAQAPRPSASPRPARTRVAEPLPADEPEPFHQPPATRSVAPPSDVTNAFRGLVLALGIAAGAFGGLVALYGSAPRQMPDPPRVRPPAAAVRVPAPPRAPWPVLTADQLRDLPATVDCPGDGCVSPFAEVAEQAGTPLHWERDDLPPEDLLVPASSTSTWSAAPADPGPLLDRREDQPPATDRVAPSFPGGAAGYPLADVRCHVVASVDTEGHPWSVEISGCPAPYHPTTADAVRQWRWDTANAVRIPVDVRYRKR